MPNHVHNTVTITGPLADRQALRKLMTTAAEAFDFNEIVPMPQELTGTHSGFTTIDGQDVQIWREVDGKAVAIPNAELERWRAEFGAANWYDWACNNWGTKWNAYSIGDWSENDTLSMIDFDTAWASPEPIFRALKDKFPSLSFKIHCGGEVDRPYTYRVGATPRKKTKVNGTA